MFVAEIIVEKPMFAANNNHSVHGKRRQNRIKRFSDHASLLFEK